MASIPTSRTAPFGAVTTFRAVGVVESVIEAIKTWKTNRRTLMALSALSDRELDDIGLCRADLSERF